MAEAIVIEGKPYVVDPTAQQTVTTVDLFKALAPRLNGPYLMTLYTPSGVFKIPDKQMVAGGLLFAFSAGQANDKVQAIGGGLQSIDDLASDLAESFKLGVTKVTLDKLVPATVPAAAPPSGGIPTIALLLGGAAVLYFIFRKKD